MIIIRYYLDKSLIHPVLAVPTNEDFDETGSQLQQAQRSTDYRIGREGRAYSSFTTLSCPILVGRVRGCSAEFIYSIWADILPPQQNRFVTLACPFAAANEVDFQPDPQ